MEDIRTKPSKSTKRDIYELIETAAASIGTMWVYTRSSVYIL